ncbi:MAG: UDP-4-amino-4,6-dideoxy-N-acetyl-beta-L-altrosamine transaminase [Eubacterium sp.]|jgi:perosamine synthetase|nr:UDP-4-amino-4,6-dideoxy-N-acetyl-beta-L-altrosamine transaminase [Eubacterium sp.]
MKMYIPYGKQFIDEEDIAAVVETLKSDCITTGPRIAEFEQAVCEYTGAKYAVAVSSGTAALHIACLAAGIGKDDEAVTSPMTFAASANCVLYCGGRPVFADIKPDTYNLDPNDVRRKITNKTKAVIAVDYTGQPCELEELKQIAKERQLYLIEDAAHAIGAEYKGRRVGSISDMTTFSLHPVKHITSGEGGIVTTNNKELYKKLILFRNHGITREREAMTKMEGGWYYEQLDLGYNYRITDFQCALAASQLKKLDRFIQKRTELAGRYEYAFQDMEDVVCPYQKEGCKNSWHLYVIQVKNRAETFRKMREAGIGVNVHYIPVYKHPYYQSLGYGNVECKNAESLYQHIISLPLYYMLTYEQQDYVIGQLKKILMG